MTGGFFRRVPVATDNTTQWRPAMSNSSSKNLWWYVGVAGFFSFLVLKQLNCFEPARRPTLNDYLYKERINREDYEGRPGEAQRLREEWNSKKAEERAYEEWKKKNNR
jgi:hypothetical protein